MVFVGCGRLEVSGHFIVLRSQPSQMSAKAGQRLGFGQCAKVHGHVAVVLRSEPGPVSHA
jgi:hypothetical protein